MGLRITTSAYADFKAVVNALGMQNGPIFAGGSWGATIFDSSRAILVTVVGLASQPAGFATDFPNAVSVSSAITGQFS